MGSQERWTEFQEIRRDLCTVHYAGAAARAGDPLAGGPSVKRGYLLRDSMIYRLEAIAFHTDLIHQRQEALERVAHPIQRNAGDHVWTASRDEKFLLDDVVFSVVSLFDYFGSWCDFLYNVELRALRGFKILRVSSDDHGSEDPRSEPPENRLRGSVVVRQASLENADWLKGLAEYRGALIHGRADEARGTLTHTFSQSEPGTRRTVATDPRITAPDSLIKRVPSLKRASEESVSVPHAAERLSGRASAALRRLLLSIIDDLGLEADPNVSRLLAEIDGKAT